MKCTNNDGAFDCHCERPGYFLDEDENCNDIDECGILCGDLMVDMPEADGSSNCNSCDPNANCFNTLGSFTCACKVGIELQK